jgi:hypothetical protein
MAFNVKERHGTAFVHACVKILYTEPAAPSD